MLTELEKSYCQALVALRNKDYENALKSFEKAAPNFGTNSEFNLLYESTRLLVEVKMAISKNAASTAIDEKELIING
jgi:hypothetical protein